MRVSFIEMREFFTQENNNTYLKLNDDQLPELSGCYFWCFSAAFILLMTFYNGMNNVTNFEFFT